MAKKILFVDMDNVLVDFASGISRISDEERSQYKDDLDEVPGIFSKMDPLEGAVESYKLLAEHFDTYILSTAPWENSSAWSDKLEWVKEHLGEEEGDPAYKRLILSHNKNLCHGDYLIDDRDANGADKFGGELLRFGKGQAYPDWKAVVAYLLPDHK